jgi:hypothetical protein
MDGKDDSPADDTRHDRLVDRLDRMVESGRVTEQEAGRLRTAAAPGEFEEGILDIRLRHAGTTLDPAVHEGSLTREEADTFLGRLRNGEHPGALRAQLRSLRRLPRSGTVAPRLDRSGSASLGE